MARCGHLLKNNYKIEAKYDMNPIYCVIETFPPLHSGKPTTAAELVIFGMQNYPSQELAKLFHK